MLSHLQYLMCHAKMTYTVLSGTLNSTIPYHTIMCHAVDCQLIVTMWFVRLAWVTLEHFKTYDM